ncbi:hypothetical protein [Lysinibacillus xylanilyticus]|uniref:hypothetical protein n=1 Tax=Lysinibacillus xylanilyticus TaxID=582475 RepID=UPI0036DD320A
MDLYIQVGVLLLMLAALSLFIYIYTAPAQQFTQKINETNQKINDRLVTVEGLDVAPFMNNVNAPGTSIYPIIRDAKASKIAVLVQTKNQQGLVVNYGHQLRSVNDPFVTMSPYGMAGVGANGGTDFEKNFVTTVKDVFMTSDSPVTYSSGMPAPIAKKTSFGSNAMFPSQVTQLMSSLIPAGSQAPGANISGSFWMAPHLMLADPAVPDASSAGALGRTFSSTGFLYTDQVLKTDAPVNNNFSYADAQGSLYRFDQNSAYYTTLILDANSDIVGIYVEEHGVDPKAAVLGSAMLMNGTITQLY